MPEDKFFESVLNTLNNKKDVNVFRECYKRRRIYEQDLAVLEEIGLKNNVRTNTQWYTKNI